MPLTGDVIMGLGDSMLVSDPPRHTRLRTLVNRAFTARRVEAMRPQVEAATAELVNELRSRLDDGADAVTDYAARLPMRVICDMLDIPHADGERLRACVEAVMSSDEGSQEQAMAGLSRRCTGTSPDTSRARPRTSPRTHERADS